MIFVGGTIPFIEYMLAIPAGIIAGVPTIPVIIFGFAGNLIGVILLIWLFDYVLAIRRKRKNQNKPDMDNYTPKSKRAQKAKKLWDKYGIPGLTFFGTGLLSSHATALMACSFGGNRAYISIWMVISLAIWSIITGVAVHFGMDVFFR
ncbi:small multi-drug export protein [Salicibibacter cibarius]|uniref:Small multi-drug export protein n=1 Tax=Salicibibacter cibarius TaxID=2743000 RepID=A0A7T7CCN3_9BACI|nr:small multi-drug export protein [Salicibibacter cibarius]